MLMEVYDYTDPACPFCTEQYEKEPPVRSIPIKRVLEKLDEYLAHDDSQSGMRLLLYWLYEARSGRDKSGELVILNELMGLSRNIGEREKAYQYAAEGTELAQKTGKWETVTGATVALNAATVYKAFGEPKRALELYEHARAIYEKHLDKFDYRVGSLYNNMGLALFELKEFSEAERLYDKALAVMEKLGSREAEMAITYLNIADLISERDGGAGEDKINTCLDIAEELLERTENRDGKYAFICEKCASVFGVYGRFVYKEKLMKRVTEIYERA